MGHNNSVAFRFNEWFSELLDCETPGKQIAIGRRIHAAFQESTEASEAAIKTALLSSATVDPFVYFLTAELGKLAIYSHCYLSGFNQFRQEIISPDSGLYRHNPEIVFLHVTLDALLPDYNPYEQEREKSLRGVIEQMCDLADSFQRFCSGALVVNNFMIPPYVPVPVEDQKLSVREWHVELNRQLKSALSDKERVIVFDYEHLAGVVGKRHVTDRKLFYLGNIVWSVKFTPWLAKEYVNIIIANKGFTKKCIVLDLDNTLWGGVVGEEGVDGINLASTGSGQEYYDFQRILKSLSKQGVLLAVNSKNNYDDALEVIRHHPAMILREDDFASLQINWHDKPDNMLRIAEELNISLNSMVFIDDNPVECEQMRFQLPEILTLLLPEDRSIYSQTLEDMAFWFRIKDLTTEDKNRSKYYVTKRNWRDLASRCQTSEEFYKSLAMHLTVKEATGSNLKRVSQLTQRTNQFNATGKKIKVSKLQEMIDADDYLLLILRVVDKFGDNGWVGVAVINTSQHFMWDVEVFLLSCRVLGRTIEKAFVDFVLQEAKQKEVSKVVFQFVASDKNLPIKTFFESYPGLQRVKDTPAATCFEADLSKLVVTFDPWIIFE